MCPFFFFILPALGYGWLMLGYWRGWKAVPDWNVPPDFTPTVSITLLVPARNEAENLWSCLASIQAGHYPSDLLEIFVIDDFSGDNTVEYDSKVWLA